MTLFGDDDDGGGGVADAYDVEVRGNANAVEAVARANGFEHNCVSVLSLVDGCSPDDA